MPANKPIRRSQLISPFGIGAMVDFPRDESLMPAGLDAWESAKQDCPSDTGWIIREERLEVRLGVTHFRTPPDFREPDPGTRFTLVSVPFIRFPRWHYCHHCGGMEILSPFSATRERCRGRAYPQQSCANKPENKRPFLIPVRFVAVCDQGHIEDFPFMEWVHRDRPFTAECHLRLRAGRSSAGLSGISLECSCGLKRNLGDVFRFDEEEGGPLAKIGCNCRGLRPWLGDVDTGSQNCGRPLRVIQRGASNAYFPEIVSAIYLPLWAEQTTSDVATALEQPHIWEELTRATVNGKIDPDRCRSVAFIIGVNGDELHAAAQRKLAGTSLSMPSMFSDEESFRRAEYQAISDGKVGPQAELYAERVDIATYASEVYGFFSRICLVHKLRETRALAGFTRILPPDSNVTGDRLQSLKLDEQKQINWLPAVKVYGEGIFLEFNIDAIDDWLRRKPGITARINGVARRYNAARALRGQPPREVTPKFVLLHTLAHVLINQLSFDCGYGSASLRERLYCDLNDHAQPMQGMLIYTASGDSEGTMGGLVRQGIPGRLEITLRRAIQRAAWCSSDPVCIESVGQGADSANLAACHGCCLLPETSCEEGNRLLDRAMLVGTPENPEMGFFKTWLV